VDTFDDWKEKDRVGPISDRQQLQKMLDLALRSVWDARTFELRLMIGQHTQEALNHIAAGNEPGAVEELYALRRYVNLLAEVK